MMRLESIPLLGYVLPARKGNRFDKNVKYKRSDTLPLLHKRFQWTFMDPWTTKQKVYKDYLMSRWRSQYSSKSIYFEYHTKMVLILINLWTNAKSYICVRIYGIVLISSELTSGKRHIQRLMTGCIAHN